MRKVLAALGLPHKGRVELTPEDIVDCQAFVEVRPSEYMSPSGETIRQNEVPYDGYRSIPEDGTETTNQKEDDDAVADIPF